MKTGLILFHAAEAATSTSLQAQHVVFISVDKHSPFNQVEIARLIAKIK